MSSTMVPITVSVISYRFECAGDHVDVAFEQRPLECILRNCPTARQGIEEDLGLMCMFLLVVWPKSIT